MKQPPAAEFFLQDTVKVAEKLIGSYLSHTVDGNELVGRIVETEAYRQDDPASHSYRGLTPRTAPMFKAGGVAYVYLIYGMYNCFNVVTESPGVGCAVLIRAVEPLAGIPRMWCNRFPGCEFDETKVHTLANGPGKLCRAFGIDKKVNGALLATGPVRILLDREAGINEIVVTRRIGITKGADLPWRFYEKGSPSVSADRKADSTNE
ncbi:MAG: DNA-3-methyladenine glycosylase [Spirochaetales bacterium]|jgi:DNA-3-methyladenine glycosylase|nr:DNA-3-methyladenine glycosylase [Spirochaetales bacterium]